MGTKSSNHRRATTGGLRAVLAVTVLALSGGTAAANDRSFYSSLGGMYVVTSDSALSVKLTNADGSYLGHSIRDLEMDPSFGLLAAFGYGADVGPRGEIEIGYRQADFDKVSKGKLRRPGRDDAPLEEGKYKGELRTWSLMANGVYAFEAGKLRPYFGLGFGLARHESRVPAQTFRGSPVQRSSSSDRVFAYQGMAGIGYAISETIEVRGGYRYFWTQDGFFNDRTHATYGSHNFEAGVRFRF